jgi:hypothetical protein
MKDSKLLRFLFGYCVIITTVLLIYFDKSSIYDAIPRFDMMKLKVIAARCGRFPTVEHVTIDNLYWQVLQMPNGFISIYNAYLDLRQNKSVVRVLVLAHGGNLSTDQLYCQLWRDETTAATAVRPSEIMLMWGELSFLFVRVLMKNFIQLEGLERKQLSML